MKGCDCLGVAVVLPEGRSWVSDIPVLGKGQLVTCGLQQDVLIGVTFRVRCLTTSTVFTCLVFFTGSINVHHTSTVTVVFDR